jgi:hypothetical protein
MFERIHQKLGTAGFIISIVALVAALGGGAYAASSNNSGQATASAKAKQGKQGKPGKPGKTGPAGPQGPAGPAGLAGAKGDTGAAGANGTNGTNGTNGVSVTTSPASIGECPSGGIKVSSASPTTKVCNGTTGFTETLPGEKTETGSWAVGVTAEFDNFLKRAALSFAIPLAAPLAQSQVHFVKVGEVAPTPGCTGGTAEEPKADPGNLCVYQGGGPQFTFVSLNNPGTEAPGAGTTGAILQLNGAEESSALGTWAVTAEIE